MIKQFALNHWWIPSFRRMTLATRQTLMNGSEHLGTCFNQVLRLPIAVTKYGWFFRIIKHEWLAYFRNIAINNWSLFTRCSQWLIINNHFWLFSIIINPPKFQHLHGFRVPPDLSEASATAWPSSPTGLPDQWNLPGFTVAPGGFQRPPLAVGIFA